MDELCSAAERNGDVPDAASFYAFVYNVRSGRCSLTRSADGLSHVTSLDNTLAESGAGYVVNDALADLATRPYGNLALSDLALTMIMLAFAEYYANNQYCVFVNACKNVPEIELIESFINAYGRSTVRLPPNLATDSVHGFRANEARFKASGTRLPITVPEFRAIVALMSSPNIDPRDFVRVVEPYHVRIVESLYTLTSITKNCRVIYECRELSRKDWLPNALFPKIVPDTLHHFDWWFPIPSKSVWFAYHDGRWSFQSYMGRDADRLMSTLHGLRCLVYGFVTRDNILYPVIFDDYNLRACWTNTVNFIAERGLNCAFRRPPVQDDKARRAICFVREGSHVVFKAITVADATATR